MNRPSACVWRWVRRLGIAGCGAGALLILAPSALAADQQADRASGNAEALFIVQIVLLLLVGRLLGEAMQRIRQPAVIGQILAGMLLGPSVFGAIWPQAQHAIFPATGEQKSMIDAVAQLGILMLLLLTGMETDLRLVRKVGRAAASISIAGVALPFACGFVLGELLPADLLPHPDQRLVASLFLGTALSISSVKIVALIVREMNFLRRNVGQVIVASAIIEDSIGWIIIAVTFGLASHGTIDLATLARSIIGTALFLVVSLTIGRRIVFTLIRWTNDTFVSEVPVITTILVIMGGMALTTHLIGVHTVLGAFVAGILVGESPILTRHIDAQLRGLITALFAPVFFGLAGVGTDLSVFKDPSLIRLALVVVAIASVGKFAGAFIGGRIGGLTLRESLALGCGMNARGSTEVIIATIGLASGVLSESLYTVIVAMAVVTTTAMPPTLRWALARLPLGREEKKRLEREEFEARGFVTNMERMLIAADASANGKFASRLAGLIAGANGMPTTLVDVGSGVESGGGGNEEGRAHAVQAAAEAAKAVGAENGRVTANVDVIRPKPDAAPEEAVASEAAKGYDLLVIGLEPVAAKGAFDPRINAIANRFEGPIAVACARGAHQEDTMNSRLNVLVPITGTEASLHAMEVGVAIARASAAPVTALYISAQESGRRAQPRQRAEAILKEAVEVADRYGVAMRTAIKRSAAIVETILREAGASRHTLIVMGVNRRPGDALFFGDVAAAILERSTRSILFVSGPRAFSAPPEAGAGKTRAGPPAGAPGAQARPARSRQSA
ncbi:MAG TPA: cation:proton antiporter [Xanthobacteraceae bacterium]|jgi:Kef-type K+ transport system membrane component KefB/nucleotide-binding universal stress UspA family protein|nr:cation:proton antiporter [Xanthobacteraceae bacterium]